MSVSREECSEKGAMLLTLAALGLKTGTPFLLFIPFSPSPVPPNGPNPAIAAKGLKPNTHHRRRRDETVLSRRVCVGGVYMNSRRLPTDSAMRTHNAAVGRDPVYNSAANGIEVR